MDEVDSGVETPAYRRDFRRSPRGSEPLEERLDRWVSRGRQLVDGVAGGRPGSRPPGRGGERRPGVRPTLDGLGRWVENRIDWLLEDGDDWREPWEEQAPSARSSESARPRRRLDAVSRRGRPLADPAASAAGSPAGAPVRPPAAPRVGDPAAADPEEWPDDAVFTLPRWQRGEGPARETPLREVGGRLEEDRQAAGGEDGTPASPRSRSGGRPLPRSSRRRV